jgi:hypothetical protein
MKRAIIVALGTGLVISSAAALGIAGAGSGQPAGSVAKGDVIQATRTREAARAEQRELINSRFVAQREQCSTLSGYNREKCVVKAHASKGRAMLEAAAPYEVRF